MCSSILVVRRRPLSPMQGRRSDHRKCDKHLFCASWEQNYFCYKGYFEDLKGREKAGLRCLLTNLERGPKNGMGSNLHRSAEDIPLRSEVVLSKMRLVIFL